MLRIFIKLSIFRGVESRDKDLYLGFFNAAIALGASIPAPIFFGYLIDNSCKLWNHLTCSSVNLQCWYYDLDSFRHIIHGIPAGWFLLKILK